MSVVSLTKGEHASEVRQPRAQTRFRTPDRIPDNCPICDRATLVRRIAGWHCRPCGGWLIEREATPGQWIVTLYQGPVA